MVFQAFVAMLITMVGIITSYGFKRKRTGKILILLGIIVLVLPWAIYLITVLARQ